MDMPAVCAPSHTANAPRAMTTVRPVTRAKSAPETNSLYDAAHKYRVGSRRLVIKLPEAAHCNTGANIQTETVSLTAKQKQQALTKAR